MYLQITNRCNMHCDHCAFSCTLQGEDMPLSTVRAALALGSDEYVTIGGGEPTIHPHFEKILLETIAFRGTGDDGVGVVTNGSIKNRALMLAQLARKGAIWAELSTDYFHDSDMVDEEVVEAFGGMTRDVTNNGNREPFPQGRYREYIGATDPSTANDCACSDIFVKPNGDIHLCGCANAPKIGDVWHGYEIPEGNISGECYLYRE